MIKLLLKDELEAYTSHKLKILPNYFNAVKEREKTFEVRKNDRDYKVNDIIKLEEYVPEKGYTGNYVFAEITYILDDQEYCKEGYIVFSINVLCSSDDNLLCEDYNEIICN